MVGGAISYLSVVSARWRKKEILKLVLASRNLLLDTASLPPQTTTNPALHTGISNPRRQLQTLDPTSCFPRRTIKQKTKCLFFQVRLMLAPRRLVDKHELTRTTVATYGLQVPPGDIIIPAIADFPATVSV